MIVDACNILEEVVNAGKILDYQVSCKYSLSNFIDYYLTSLGCPDCENKPKKCAKKEVCDNTVLYINCCDLCIYPNNDQRFKCIHPNNTIVDVKFISPNNENQCQE